MVVKTIGSVAATAATLGGVLAAIPGSAGAAPPAPEGPGEARDPEPTASTPSIDGAKLVSVEEMGRIAAAAHAGQLTEAELAQAFEVRTSCSNSFKGTMRTFVRWDSSIGGYEPYGTGVRVTNTSASRFGGETRKYYNNSYPQSWSPISGPTNTSGFVATGYLYGGYGWVESSQTYYAYDAVIEVGSRSCVTPAIPG
jgi:hypothetical protein